jgi:CMP-N-acetylneuraminic acid synthetase
MKRLLAYLIVVISLGLTFNVSANSAQDQLSNTVWKLNSSGNHIVFLENSTCLYTMNITALINKAYYNESSCTWKNIKKNDSLMGVTKIQDFIYDNKKPINFNKNKEKWPRTQTLKKLYIINNTIFISSKKNYINLDDRI